MEQTPTHFQTYPTDDERAANEEGGEENNILSISGPGEGEMDVT